jgi:hypothetical protein
MSSTSRAASKEFIYELGLLTERKFQQDGELTASVRVRETHGLSFSNLRIETGQICIGQFGAMIWIK